MCFYGGRLATDEMLLQTSRVRIVVTRFGSVIKIGIQSNKVIPVTSLMIICTKSNHFSAPAREHRSCSGNCSLYFGRPPIVMLETVYMT